MSYTVSDWLPWLPNAGHLDVLMWAPLTWCRPLWPPGMGPFVRMWAPWPDVGSLDLMMWAPLTWCRPLWPINMGPFDRIYKLINISLWLLLGYWKVFLFCLSKIRSMPFVLSVVINITSAKCLRQPISNSWLLFSLEWNFILQNKSI